MRVRSGVPSWVDLCSPDPAATVAFYSGLFGWTARASADPDYTDFFSGDTRVAAAGPVTAAEQSVCWTTYVTTANVDEVTSSVLRNGGTMLMAPTRLDDGALHALFLDPTGAPFGAWQPAPADPGADPGAASASHGTLAWNELTTRDPWRAGSFYQQVFGWLPTEDVRQPGAAEHTTWLLEGVPVGGMITMTADRWRTPARWTVYFAVDDCDSAAWRTRQLGGSVTVPPTDIAAGRFALVRDPHGAMFSLLTAQ